jgi:predicted Zn-dependent peptidase
MKYILLAVLALAPVCSTLHAQPANAQSRTATPKAPAKTAAKKSAGKPVYEGLQYPPLRPVELPKIEEFTLPNGLKVKLLENRELPLVGGSMIFRTGNLLEPKDKVGLAGLTGQVMRSGGTKSLKPDDLNARLENMAASVESSIGEERGTVGFRCLKENTAEVLALFKQVITEPAFAPDRVELALTQSRSSISRRNDNAGAIASREFRDMIYGKDTPYGASMEYETLNNIKREDMVAWHDRYFFPANAMLAVQGDFNAAEMRALLEKTFADWTVTRPPVPAYPQVTRQKAAGVYVADKPDSEQTFFQIGHIGGKISDKDYAALDVMADILGGGFSSRLFQTVRSDKSLAYAIGASWSANYSYDGLFRISGSTKAETTEEAIATSIKEAKRMQEEMVGPAELAAAKQRVENSFVFFFDSPAKTLNRFMTYDFYGYPRDFINQYKEAVAKVTAQDIQRVAKQYIKPEEFTIVAVGKTAEFADSLKTFGEVKKLDISIPEPKVEAAKADAASLAKGAATLKRIAEAAGGEAKFLAVKDWSQSIDAELPMGGNKMQVKQVNQWLAPNHFRQTNELPFGKTIVYFDGAAGFIKTPQGEQPLPPPFIGQIKAQLARDIFSLMRSSQFAGRTVNFVSDGLLEIQDPDSPPVQLNYDPATFLITKLSLTQGGATQDTFFSDYKEVNGLKLPMRQEIKQAGQEVTQTVTEWKINSGLTVEQLGSKQ